MPFRITEKDNTVTATKTGIRTAMTGIGASKLAPKLDGVYSTAIFGPG
jgi:hypothetical protein